VRGFSPEDGVCGDAGDGAVPVGLRAMSRLEPQLEQAGSDPATGVAHVGHENMERLALYEADYVKWGEKCRAAYTGLVSKLHHVRPFPAAGIQTARSGGRPKPFCINGLPDGPGFALSRA
jgi:hypothetical protein